MRWDTVACGRSGAAFAVRSPGHRQTQTGEGSQHTPKGVQGTIPGPGNGVAAPRYTSANLCGLTRRQTASPMQIAFGLLTGRTAEARSCLALITGPGSKGFKAPTGAERPFGAFFPSLFVPGAAFWCALAAGVTAVSRSQMAGHGPVRRSRPGPCAPASSCQNRA